MNNQVTIATTNKNIKVYQVRPKAFTYEAIFLDPGFFQAFIDKERAAGMKVGHEQPDGRVVYEHGYKVYITPNFWIHYSRGGAEEVWINTNEGGIQKVEMGNWIVNFDGVPKSYSPDQFEKAFEFRSPDEKKRYERIKKEVLLVTPKAPHAQFMSPSEMARLDRDPINTMSVEEAYEN